MVKKNRLLGLLFFVTTIFSALFGTNLPASDIQSLPCTPNGEWLLKDEATEDFKVGNGVTIKVQYNRSRYCISGENSYLNYAHIQALKKQGNFNSIKTGPDKKLFIVFEPPKSVVNVYDQITSKKKTFVLIETSDEDDSAMPLSSVATEFLEE